MAFPMAATDRTAALKVVGSNGQISLGKHDAGRHVLVEESEPGDGAIRPGNRDGLVGQS